MRELLLFFLQLFNALPHYDPKSNIEFKCILGEEVVKTIELTNPTLKPISYCVKLENKNEKVQDFSLESEDNFVIDPKSVFKYKVKFISRVSDI